jgi:hypothetical protein
VKERAHLDAECRRFLRRLAEAADDHRADPHASRCRWCAARLAAARRYGDLLRSLPPPPPPAALATPELFAAILARASERVEEDLGAILHAGMAAVPAPADASWREPMATPELAARLRDGLRGGPAPGWRWVRIRADVRTWRVGRRRAARLRVGLLAAALLVGAFLAFRTEGTYPPAEPVFVKVTEPLDAALIGGGWTRLGR